jgi:hypothetical protein
LFRSVGPLRWTLALGCLLSGPLLAPPAVAIAPRQDGLRTLKKQDLEKITHDTERDYFMSADEAKDHGIIDRVIEHH